MHQLDRSRVPAPPCLAAYDYQIHSWADIDHPCKFAVRTALHRMQGTPVDGANIADDGQFIGLRCAYCESEIRHEGHIEHFRRKNRRHPNGYPALTFD